MKYAVAYVNFFDNDLQLRVVKARGWKQAVSRAFDCAQHLTSETLDEAKEEAFNQDWLFNVLEIDE